MEILQVVDELVTTSRVPGLKQMSLRVVTDGTGKLSVATDPIGVPPGKWGIYGWWFSSTTWNGGF